MFSRLATVTSPKDLGDAVLFSDIISSPIFDTIIIVKPKSYYRGHFIR